MSIGPALTHLALLGVVWSTWWWCARAFVERWSTSDDAESELVVHALPIFVAVPIALVVGLGWLGGIGRLELLGLFGATQIGFAIAAGRAARRRSLAALRTTAGHWLGLVRSRFVGLVLAGLLALASAIAAAVLLDPWGWDALGYHLPIVFDAVATGRFGAIDSHVPYVHAYPRGIEAFFVAFTLTVPDDRLVELGQVPFALAGVGIIGTLARRAGAGPGRSRAYALAWFCTPVVWLQFAQAYVDIAHATLVLTVAALVTGEPTRLHRFTIPLALALLLGSKPSAPLPFAIAGLFWLWRHRTERPTALAGLVIAGLLGGASYLRNLVQHGNPVYPVALDLGPLHLPGNATPAMFFGVNTPPGFADLGWAERLVRSWLTIPSAEQYLYDMRLGWHGPLWWGLLAIGLALVLRRVRPDRIVAPVLLVCACTLATPAAFWPRFTVAMPAILLAAAAASAARIGARAAALLDVVITIGSAVALAWSVRGLTGEGPPIWEVLGDPSAATRVSADGQLAAWIEVRERVRPGHRFVYDESLDLPGLLWRPDRSIEVDFVPIAELETHDLSSLRAHDIDAIAVDRDSGLAERLAAERAPAFACRVGRCLVFAL